MDLANVTAGEVYGMFREALNTGDYDLAEILAELELAIRGEHHEERVQIETRLLPLFMARGVQS